MKKLYSVYDVLNGEFAQPFMLNNDNAAVDMFVKDVKSIAKQNLAKFQELDIERFQLYRLADFDNEHGLLHSEHFISGDYGSFNPILIYDVKIDFDFSEFDEQLNENEKTRGMEVKSNE